MKTEEKLCIFTPEQSSNAKVIYVQSDGFNSFVSELWYMVILIIKLTLFYVVINLNLQQKIRNIIQCK